MLKYFLLVLSFLVLAGCLKKKDADLTVIYFKATCKLQDVGSANLACIKYRNEYGFDPSADCDLLETNYNASISSYIDSQQECTSTNIAGICEVDHKRVYYYQTLFTVTQARDECIGLGGSPQ